MNTNKCNYIVFTKGQNKILKLMLNNQLIPYCENPKFLGVVFDKTLSFNRHFENLRARALKRLNLIKIFSHKSWGLSTKTLKCIYRALVGSIFDYSFFAVVNVSTAMIQRLQTIQNAAFRRIHHLPRRTRVTKILELSEMMNVKDRMISLGLRYLAKAMRRNPLIKQIVAEFISTRSKYTWFVGSPLAVLMPLTAVAKAIYIYCNFMAFYIYLMAIANIEICKGASRVKLKGLLGSLGPLIRETCLLQPGPLTPHVYEVE